MRKHAGIVTVLGTFLAAAMIAVAPAAGQTAAAAQTSATAAKPFEVRTNQDAIRGEGITVHGHWTIDVRNPDGTLASHHEFENALVPTLGPQLLNRLLSSSNAIRTWDIQLSTISGGAAGPCVPPGGSELNGVCNIAGPNSTLGSYYPPEQLFETGAFQITPEGVFEITGNVTVTAAQPIGSVLTMAELNPWAGFLGFTRKTLETPIQVAPGQTVYVRVLISFS